TGRPATRSLDQRSTWSGGRRSAPMMRPPSLLKASSRRTSSSSGADALPRRAYNSDDDIGWAFPSMRNLLDTSSVAQGLDGLPYDGEPASIPACILLTMAVAGNSSPREFGNRLGRHAEFHGTHTVQTVQ